jgi:hypothetical protein
MLALSDLPSLDSPMARLSMMYVGRLKYLRALRQYGRDRGWNVNKPAGRNATLTLAGAFDPQHPVAITSSANHRLSPKATARIR